MSRDALTIVMYHYVRDLRNSRYPEINGLDSVDFEGQIGYIKKHYNVISGQELMDAIEAAAPLPPRPLMLTFDDGYIDHFTTVAPVLEREHLPGCFFPPGRCVLENSVLDVNKIHFVLASVPDKKVLVEAVCNAIDDNRSCYGLAPAALYRERFERPGRYDNAAVAFCKAMLQRELPLELRQAITDGLFRQYVSKDEAAFSRELYMGTDQIRALNSSGMYIGSHGYDHFWLDTLDVREQETEIDKSLAFLRSVGGNTERWIMCYPYGACNESLLAVLRSRHCIAGLTTAVDVASPGRENALRLPRLDTNDLPKDPDAADNVWMLKVAG